MEQRDDQLGQYKPLVEEYENSCMKITSIYEDIDKKNNDKLYNNTNIERKCYLIETKDFEDYKKQIHYIQFKNKVDEYRYNMAMELTMKESEGKTIKHNKIKQKTVDSINELYKLLEENHEYILINVELAKDIIENIEEGQYSYFIDSSEIIVKINEKVLKFYNKKNIINKENIKEKENLNEIINKNENLNENINKNENLNRNELKDLIDLIEKFYLAEKKFGNLIKGNNNELNKENKVKEYGYLINIKDFQDWEISLNYDSIRPILDKSIKDNSCLSEENKNVIMEILKTKSFKKKNIKSLHFETIEELINFNKKNNFFFLNREL